MTTKEAEDVRTAAAEPGSDAAATPLRPWPQRYPSNPDSAYIVEWSADVPDPRRQRAFDPDEVPRQDSI